MEHSRNPNGGLPNRGAGTPDTGNAKRPSVRHIEIGPDNDGQRIDNFLISVFKTVPRSLVYRLLRTGQVRVNKGRIKPAFRLSEGDSVRIPPVTVPERQAARVPKSVIEALRSSIIAEEPHWIVINKPAGIASHGGTGLEFGVIDAVIELFDEKSISLVHRLDKSTSGVMVLARSRVASVHFQQCMKERRVSKHYAALLCGALKKSRTVTARLLKTHPTPNENRVIIDTQDGKEAISHFHSRTVGPHFTLADIEIETGRTHQIRVHGASIGHPVLGDERYGREKINRQQRSRGVKRMFLHARSIEFPELGDKSVHNDQGDTEAQVSSDGDCRKFSAAFDPEWLDVLNAE